MKLSISLPDEDVAALDRYAQAAGIISCSAAIQRAIRLLSGLELGDAYAAAWDEWEVSGDAAAWELEEGQPRHPAVSPRIVTI